jgi:hypothetical protein
MVLHRLVSEDRVRCMRGLKGVRDSKNGGYKIKEEMDVVRLLYQPLACS